jgi:hypothetical protein
MSEILKCSAQERSLIFCKPLVALLLEGSDFNAFSNVKGCSLAIAYFCRSASPI